jgi:hypothetical protein
MKVEELIEKLNELPKEQEVLIYVSTMDESYPIDCIDSEYGNCILRSWK